MKGLIEEKETIQDIKKSEQASEEAFTQNLEAVIAAHDDIDINIREHAASRLDTNNRDAWTLHPDRHFDFSVPNWNDSLDHTQMRERCFEITDIIKRLGYDRSLGRDAIHNITVLLDNSFSEEIKQHIVTLTSGSETVEGACYHCLGLYGEESNNREISIPVSVWCVLSDLVGNEAIYNAFLERSWHLTPSSQYFPNRYSSLINAAMQQHLDIQRRRGVHYDDPHCKLFTLNEDVKRLNFNIRHCDDPKTISRLITTKHRVLGAMHIIRDRLENKNQKAIQDAKDHVIDVDYS